MLKKCHIKQLEILQLIIVLIKKQSCTNLLLHNFTFVKSLLGTKHISIPYPKIIYFSPLLINIFL